MSDRTPLGWINVFIPPWVVANLVMKLIEASSLHVKGGGVRVRCISVHFERLTPWLDASPL